MTENKDTPAAALGGRAEEVFRRHLPTARSDAASSTTTRTKGGAAPAVTVGRNPSRARRRHRLHVLMPWRAATATTVAPGSWLSATIRACSTLDQRR